MSCYAIGDVHGCLKTLKKLLFEAIKIKANDHIIFLGDYIDRGPDSKGVIDLLIELQHNKDYTIELLMGNHESSMLKSINNQIDDEGWLHYGGTETLRSFDVSVACLVDRLYIDFLKSLKSYTSYKDYLLVHGGFNFEIEDIFEDEKAMLWARYYSVDPAKTGGKTVVHGHTPVIESELKALVNKNTYEINLDNGCVYHDKEGKGALYAMNLDNRELINVAYCG